MPNLAPGMGTINLSVTTTLTVIADVNSYWKLLVAATSGTLVSAIASTDTTVVTNKLTGTKITQNAVANANFYFPQGTATPVNIAVDSTILVDSEEMIVTAVSDADGNGNYTLTVSRGTTPTNSTGTTVSFPYANPVAHQAGAPISILTHASPWEMAKNLWLLPGAAQVVQQLGVNSSMFQSSASGSVTIAGS